MDALLAVAGGSVTALVIVAMILLTPRGTVPARRNPSGAGEPAEPLAPLEES